MLLDPQPASLSCWVLRFASKEDGIEDNPCQFFFFFNSPSKRPFRAYFVFFYFF